MTRWYIWIFLFAFALVGCGGDEGGGQTPVTDVLDAIEQDILAQDNQGQQHEVEIVEEDVQQLDQTDVFVQPDNVVEPDTTVVPDLPADISEVPDTSVEPEVSQPEVPAGNGTCVDIMKCLNENACTDQACVSGCMAQGSVEAQNQFTALAQCEVQQCGQYGKDKPSQTGYCVYSKCKTQNQPCTPTGTLGCMGILQCIQGCGNPPDKACALDCVSQGTYDGQTALFGVLACIEEKCPTVTQQCMISNCMQQLMTCQSS